MVEHLYSKDPELHGSPVSYTISNAILRLTDSFAAQTTGCSSKFAVNHTNDQQDQHRNDSYRYYPIGSHPRKG